MFYTQFENKSAKQWIENSAVCLTRAKEYNLFSDGYFLALNNAQDKLCIYDITGCHAMLRLNNKQIKIMQEKEEHIALLQTEENEKDWK